MALQDLICLPFAGGGTAFYYPWTVHPDPCFRVHPVCLPGREGKIRETPFTRMNPLLDWLDAQLSHTMQQPHILFGHSMGGVVSYALCLRRMKCNLPLPKALVVSACMPPPMQRQIKMHSLEKTALLEQLRGYDPVNMAFDAYPELWDLMEPVLRADFSVIETYEPEQIEPLPIPIIALSGRDDPLISPASMGKWANCGSAFQHHQFAGGHFFLRQAPREILDCVKRSVQEMTDLLPLQQ
ncbi:MAG: thioesterase II family protein [Sulfitobacter sp.]